MGTYCTTSALKILMVGVTFDDQTEALADKAITHAEGEIDKNLSRRYDISTLRQDPPPHITDICEKLATGYTWMWQARGGKSSLAMGKDFIKEAMANIKALQEFKADLLDRNNNPIADKTDSHFRVLSNTTDFSTTFNEDPPEDWTVDNDKLDDIADERSS